MARPETRPDEDLALADHLDPAERDPEAPTADAVEQAVAADPGQQPAAARSRGLEVGEWDAAEQAIVVDLDDDYDH